MLPDRPGIHEYFLRMADLVASRSTCYRRQVGCVLVSRRNHVLATGYNGVPARFPHCRDPEGERCRAALAPSGTRLDECLATHAEQNALLQCHDVYQIETAYCTTAPCWSCAKLLVNTGVHAIYYLEDYPETAAVREFLTKAGIKLIWHPCDFVIESYL